MYDRILVPLDGSDFSEEVIRYAAGMAAAHNTPLTLMRIVDKAADEVDAMNYVEPLAAAYNARGLCVIATGEVAETILAEASRVPGTLVAMTSRGRSGLMEAVLGSVAMDLVRNAGAPVLVYHPTGQQGRDADKGKLKINTVMLPIDGSMASEAMAEQAANLARWLDAELMVVSVIDPKSAGGASLPTGSAKAMESSYVRSRASDYAKRFGVRVSWETLYGEPVEALASFVGGRQDMVLAMVTRGQSALKSAFLGSVTSGCLSKVGVPVLMRLP